MTTDRNVPKAGEIDPSTPEGWAEVQKRARRSKDFIEELRKLAKSGGDQPSGKLTRPNEMDLHRDRKGDD
jgi:hypothetical protein